MIREKANCRIRLCRCRILESSVLELVLCGIVADLEQAVALCNWFLPTTLERCQASSVFVGSEEQTEDGRVD